MYHHRIRSLRNRRISSEQTNIEGISSAGATRYIHNSPIIRMVTNDRLIGDVVRDPWYASILNIMQASHDAIPLHTAIILPPFWTEMMNDPYVSSNHYDVASMLVFQHNHPEYSGDLEVRLSGIDPGNPNDRGLFSRRSLQKGFRIGMWGALGKSNNIPLSKYQSERNIELHLNEPRCNYWFVFHPACLSGFINNRDSKRLGPTNCSMHVNGLALKISGAFRWNEDLYFAAIDAVCADTQLLMRYGFHK